MKCLALCVCALFEGARLPNRNIVMENIVITGATSGFGVNWLYELDKVKEAVFFVLGRDEKRFTQLLQDSPMSNKAYFIQCNLDSLHSIANAIKEIQSQADKIDLLINNAGVFSSDIMPLSQDGIELTLAVNQLAPFVLTGKLLPLLSASSQASIVNTASFRHKDAKVDLTDIELRKNFNAEIAYCNSKLYSVLFTRALARRLHSSQISVNCFDPGIVDTPMLSRAFPSSLAFMYPLFRKWVARTPSKGAETGVFLSKGVDVTGQYFKDGKTHRVSKKALDDDVSNWLWSESERLTGFIYG